MVKMEIQNIYLSVEIGILKTKSRFPNQTHPKAFKSFMNNNINNKNDPIRKDQDSIKKLVLGQFIPAGQMLRLC